MLPETVALVGRSKFNKLVVYDKLKLMDFCQPEAFFNFVRCPNDPTDVSTPSRNDFFYF